MVQYENSKIYKIINDVDDKKYYGSSTVKLSSRFCKHKSQYRAFLKKGGGCRRFFEHIQEVGLEHFHIILIENYPCSSKEELLRRERHYISKLMKKDRSRCLNINLPGRTQQEYRDETKDKKANYDRQRYLEKREKILQQRKAYIQQNKKKIAAYHSSEQVRARKNAYRRVKVPCEFCDKVLSRACIFTHIRKQHYQF